LRWWLSGLSCEMDDPAPADLRAFRALILDRMLRWSAAVTTIPCVAGVWLALENGLWPVAALDGIGWAAITAAAVARSWPYEVRAGVLLAAFGGVGSGVLAALGPFGVGLLWLLGLPSAAAVLLGTRAFWIAEGVVLAVLLAIGLAARAGLLWWAELGVPPAWWVLAAFSIVSVSLLVGLSTSVLADGLDRSLREVEAARVRALEVNRALIVAQKMELVGQLAGGVAHDLNNVLTVVQVEGNRARADVPDGSEAAQSLDHLLAGASSAAALCAKLLLFARKRAGDRAPVRVDEQVRSMEALLRSLAGERVRLHVALGAPLACVRAEPVELEQMLTNLVANARDALPAGGDVWVETGEVVGERGRQVRIEVRDAGVGIDPATLGRVFEPFFTTKDEGTGLGLATVYALVQSLDGVVAVDSRPGEGTTFRLVLPRAAEDRAEQTPSLPSMRMPGTARTVLLVEDNPLVRPVIARLLEHIGCRVVAVASVREALAALEGGPTPDLVLTDVLMPEQTGADLAEALRERAPSLPVLAMSGWLGDDELAVRLGRLGVPVLRKPFTPDALARAVAEGLAARAVNG
jgi:signal transduction histidine kinase/CheY-like chemotaxis protein